MIEEAQPSADSPRASPRARAKAFLGHVAAALRAPVIWRSGPPAWHLLAAPLAGGLLSLSYMGPMLPEFAFVAPAIFLYLVAKARPGGAAVLGALFGVAFGGRGLVWVAAVTGAGWAGLLPFCGVLFAGLGACVSFLGRRTRLPVVAVVPPVWVAFELLRGHIFTGFPWLYLGHALSERLTLVQIADLGGAYAVSFVAALWCAGLAGLALQAETSGLRRWGPGWRGAAIGAGALAVTLAYGAWRLGGVRTHPGPTLVMVQGNIYTPRAAKDEKSRKSVDEEIWRVLEPLSREGARDMASSEDGGLLVWSESMLPGYYNDPTDYDSIVWGRRLKKLLGEIGLPLLAGSNATGLHPGVPREGPPPERRMDYNAAFLVGTDGAIAGRYDKMHLVPFGEYIPLARWPFLSGVTPYAADDPGYAHGDTRQPLIEWGGVSFGVLICYEDVFAALARRAVRRGADVLVNLSSESWFAGTEEIPQHLRIARFRAIETRLPLVRCCNVGVTAVIDPAGRAVAILEGSDRPEGATGTLVARLPLANPGRGTVYAYLGDAFALLCAAASVALAVLALRPRPPGRALAA